MSTVRHIQLVVPGHPVGKDRPRYDSRSGRTYTPTPTLRAERVIRRAWQAAGSPRLPDDVAIGMALRIVMKRPRGHFRKNGELSAAGRRHPLPLRTKPDWDNAAKLCVDALNDRAYVDDVRVTDATVRKRWGPEEMIVIRLWVLDGVESKTSGLVSSGSDEHLF